MRVIILCLLLIFPLPAVAGDETTDALPLPRFVSLKSSEVNVRSGPGERYPILWIYKRKNLPVEIIEEFEHWRKIRDAEGEEGWVLKSLLDGRRYGMVKGTGVVTLLREPEKKAPPILRAGKGVIGRINECNESWCRLQIDSRKGWLPKKQLWGIYKNELIEN